MKKEVATLSGEELNCWVARAEGYQVGELEGRPGSLVIGRNGVITHIIRGCTVFDCLQYGYYSPSKDWKQGGPILAREGIQVAPDIPAKDRWLAGKTYGSGWHDYLYGQIGQTVLEAVMRCYVASKFGDTVDDGADAPALTGGQEPEQGTPVSEIDTSREDAWL